MPRDSFPRLDNSVPLKQRRIDVDPFRLTVPENSEMKPGRKLSLPSVVANRSSTNVITLGEFSRSPERLDHGAHIANRRRCSIHDLSYSRHLKIVKRLERELISRGFDGTIERMAARPTNARSVDAIAARLEATRRVLELSQTALCDRAGLAKNTYNQWERARGRPELDQAMKLCDAFNLTLDWIYLGDMSGLPARIANQISISSD